MYRWMLYQIEEVVILSLDTFAYCVDLIFYLPWQEIFKVVLAASLVVLLMY